MSRRRSAFHQPEVTQLSFACLVSVETVQDKIWNQKGSLIIATFTVFARQLDARHVVSGSLDDAGKTTTLHRA